MLKFSDKPQLIYGNQQSADSWRERFPAHAKPIATAPEYTSQAVIVYEPNGQGHLAMHHRNAWRKLTPRKDSYTGAISRVQDGTMIDNPVMWTPLQKR